MANYSIISEGAMKRLFNMAFHAHEWLDDNQFSLSDKEYQSDKKRTDQWDEIIMALGLTNEFRQYYAEKRGQE